jgi:DNA-directed RNA polymerase specialized sigma subunit
MSQAEIAVEVGVSQVHVSRLLRAALETLRAAA